VKALPRNVLLAFIATGSAFLGACQSNEPGPGPLAFTAGNMAALPTMERIARSAHTCWFGSKDPSFRSFRLADELNSYSGRPRILLVPAGTPEARPLLVVHAEGNPARVEVFGPLMAHQAGSRIAADVQRWAGGSNACSGNA